MVVVDMWAGPAEVGPEDLSDGLHFGPGGNEKMFAALQSCIKDQFGDALNADDGPDGTPLMPMQFPYWAVATPDNIPGWEWPPARASVAGTGAAAASGCIDVGAVARAKAERG